MKRTDNLIWVDLEMTGLEVESCGIIEIATLVTDSELNIVAHGPELVIHQSRDLLDSMDEWNTNHHRDSGLTELVKNSKIDLAEAERQTLAFVKEHCEANASPLCGNSVGHDRMFLRKYMPGFLGFLHYRNIDVSTVKELVRRWYGDAAIPGKKGSHRALGDIVESIEELKHYRAACFVENGPQ